MTPDDPLSALAGVGPARLAQLDRLGLARLRDLLEYAPRHYLDCRHPVLIADLMEDELAVVRARVLNLKLSRSRRGQAVVRAILADASGEIEAVWFNQPYLADSLQSAAPRLFVGKPKRDWRRRLTLPGPTLVPDARIIPIYSVTKGLSSVQLARLIATARAAVSPELLAADPWPAAAAAIGLPDLPTALGWLHEPDTPEQYRAARRRLVFDQLVQLQRGLWGERRAAEALAAPVVPTDTDLLKRYRASLPFDLTEDQVKAIWRLAQDLSTDRATRRLLNGDVGSGKTAVAAAGLLLAAAAGQQAVLLAPTDLLVQQHAKTLRRLLNGFNISVGVVTARQKEWEGQVLVGTHALFAPGARGRFRSVGLVVIDEQHRFGVEQRDKLWRLTESAAGRPHLLSLSATPIPRSLALTLYGGQPVSRLRQKPAGRQPVSTILINESEVMPLLIDTVARGEQAYVVCPLIDEVALAGSLLDERRTVAAVVEETSAQLKTARIGGLHGKLPAVEKDRLIGDFASGRLDILVSTTVVEVGVDVPNATLMVIENAERFGIAQLHQLRGRVGRGERPSTCALLIRSASKEARARCAKVAATADGFALAEFDLRERGPGELIGLSQSGRLDFLDELDVDLIAAADRLAAEQSCTDG